MFLYQDTLEPVGKGTVPVPVAQGYVTVTGTGPSPASDGQGCTPVMHYTEWPVDGQGIFDTAVCLWYALEPWK
jgi:hypothetical protein